MIKLAFDADFHQLEQMTIQEITDRIIHIHYPQLTVRLNLIEEQIMLQAINNNAVEKAALASIRQELNGMLAKEQMLLYPLLLILQKENRKSDCAPFKLVKKHYRALLSNLQNLRFQLLAITAALPQLQPALIQIDELEDSIVHLQRAKEKHLFAPFKYCRNDCKIPQNE